MYTRREKLNLMLKELFQKKLFIVKTVHFIHGVMWQDFSMEISVVVIAITWERVTSHFYNPLTFFGTAVKNAE